MNEYCLERLYYRLFHFGDSLMQWVLISVFLILSTSWAGAQDCQQVCDDYKSYARKAGDPRTMEPLLKLYQACMACAKGAGNTECSSVQAPENGTGIRCEYAPNGQTKDGPANR
jgi:hypothetical protein